MSNVVGYAVTGYAFLDGVMNIVLTAMVHDDMHALGLARFSANTFCERVTVDEIRSDGAYRTIFDYRHDGIGDGSSHDERSHYFELRLGLRTIGALDQLHELGQLRDFAPMPDPDDSEFFATPCEPMAAV